MICELCPIIILWSPNVWGGDYGVYSTSVVGFGVLRALVFAYIDCRNLLHELMTLRGVVK